MQKKEPLSPFPELSSSFHVVQSDKILSFFPKANLNKTKQASTLSGGKKSHFGPSELAKLLLSWRDLTCSRSWQKDSQTRHQHMTTRISLMGHKEQYSTLGF